MSNAGSMAQGVGMEQNLMTSPLMSARRTKAIEDVVKALVVRNGETQRNK
jgi:hypothetical protein